MGFLDRFKKKEEQPLPQPQKEERGVCSVALQYSGTSQSMPAMSLAAVYRCVEVISDSVAQLPIGLYKVKKGGNVPYLTHPAYWLVAKEPSPMMSRFTFIKLLVTSTILRGNGYAYIKRDQMGNAKELIFIDAGKVTVEVRANNEVVYNGVGFGLIPARDMIHIINYTIDGIHGISTLANAANTIGLASASEYHANSFFTGGANVGGILNVQGPLNQKQSEEIKNKWNNAFGPVGVPNGVAVLPGNMQFQKITVDPADAQLLETRQYSVVDICRFFGVSPVKCFDLSHSSYSTVEATQLAFLTDTLSPILEKIELEFERKLFRADEKWRIDVRFDTSALLRADTSSRASYYNTLFNMGAISANEIRAEMGMQPIDGGDEHFVQVNLQTLSAAIKAASAADEPAPQDDIPDAE